MVSCNYQKRITIGLIIRLEGGTVSQVLNINKTWQELFHDQSIWGYGFYRVGMINDWQKIIINKLHKLYNRSIHSLEGISKNCHQILTSRQLTFQSNNETHYNLQVGKNTQANRCNVVCTEHLKVCVYRKTTWVATSKIPLIWLNMSIESFKVKREESMFYNDQSYI